MGSLIRRRVVAVQNGRFRRGLRGRFRRWLRRGRRARRRHNVVRQRAGFNVFEQIARARVLPNGGVTERERRGGLQRLVEHAHAGVLRVGRVRRLQHARAVKVDQRGAPVQRGRAGWVRAVELLYGGVFVRAALLQLALHNLRAVLRRAVVCLLVRRIRDHHASVVLREHTLHELGRGFRAPVTAHALINLVVRAFQRAKLRIVRKAHLPEPREQPFLHAARVPREHDQRGGDSVFHRVRSQHAKEVLHRRLRRGCNIEQIRGLRRRLPELNVRRKRAFPVEAKAGEFRVGIEHELNLRGARVQREIAVQKRLRLVA
ncbi:hypothetical protein SDC9_135165 [bioreactor metagenome]|uniref:Uncharacterized protein n=1 Tax=bioreactor metagenome TaxID=1076179 RepID=A0A645DF39_9ZZZZ